MTNAYKHTQIGYTLIVAYCIVVLILGMLASVVEFRHIAMVGLLVVLLALSTFATLTITVNDRTLQLRYGVGLIRKRFPLNEAEKLPLNREIIIGLPHPRGQPFTQVEA